jgi:membrane protein DedA with SNARE-associated domain
VISVFASFLVAMLGYGLCRAIGPRAALWIAGPKEMEKLSGFFERCGMWGIAVSRLLPWVPEILACLAGLSRMSFPRFATGNLIGSVAVGFINAYFGSRGETDPETVAFVLVLPYIMIPIFLFILARGFMTTSPAKTAKTDTSPTDTPA